MDPPGPADSPNDLSLEKEALRASMRQKLRDLPPRAAESAGQRIAEKIVLTAAWDRAECVAIYAALPGEVDTRPIFSAARAAEKAVLFPRVVSSERMEFACVDDFAQLRRGRFNILEPERDAEAVVLQGNTLVLVPGLAFDRAGGRLGRGAGYYDRALSVSSAGIQAEECGRPIRFGIGFDLQIVPRVPMGQHDMKMDEVWAESSP